MIGVDAGREHLRALSARLLRLHAVLLERERRAWEARTGVPSASQELFRLLLEDPEFSWLRAISSLVAAIDERVDAEDPVPDTDVAAAWREAYRLLKSGDGGEFRVRYHAALQDSPDVVMAHADVSKLLRDAPR